MSTIVGFGTDANVLSLASLLPVQLSPLLQRSCSLMTRSQRGRRSAGHSWRHRSALVLVYVSGRYARGRADTSDLVVLVGANGSGKSTLLEGIAEAYGLDVRGGHGGRRYSSPLDKSPLGEALRLRRTKGGSKFTGRNATGFFLRAETAHGMLAYMTDMGIAGYGDRLSWEVSHGESYLQAITGRFNGPGLYLLDEAEGPLSFQSTLLLLYHLRELVTAHNAQVLYSTHSPLVAALPGAQILELSDDGIHEQDWSDLEAVRLWQAFLRHPQRMFDAG